jgi:hypothetical protein
MFASMQVYRSYLVKLVFSPSGSQIVTMSASSSDAGIVAASEDDESSVVVEVVPDESSVELVSVVLVSVVDELSLVLEESVVELVSVVLLSVVDELSLVPELAFLFSSSLTASHSSSDRFYSAQTSSTTSDP